ncbi:MerR family transcriptional regulator [Nocardioides albertanoniae]|nr:MerR family transcriptional regulator [Nocardioides albertanoniae]
MAESRQDTDLTVGDTAALVGVTVRTLHHWDEIGLATPSGRTPAGYRLYTGADLERLCRILAYRETGLSLDAIRGVLDDAATGIAATLEEQRERLAERICDLQRIDKRLARLADAHQHGILLSAEEQKATFGPDWDPQQGARARARWGDSPQWAQFAERAASRSPDDWRDLSDAMSRLEQDLGAALARGVRAGSPEANDLADRHRAIFGNFFPITRQMQVCLGRMFEDDAGFAAHYDGIRDGLATWFRQIIDEAARGDGIDPDLATWQ